MGFLSVLWIPQTSQKYASRWIGDPKLPFGVSKWVNVCMVLWDGLQSQLGVFASCPVFPG